MRAGYFFFVAAVAVSSCRGSCDKSQASDGGADSLTSAAERLGRRTHFYGRAPERADPEPDDLMRLAEREGAMGLVEGASDPSRRAIALRALGFTDSWDGLPFLVDAITTSPEPEAKIAAESLVELAARRRRPVDPEDALELKDGCARLTALVKDPKAGRSPEVKRLVTRALLMIADSGRCDPP